MSTYVALKVTILDPNCAIKCSFQRCIAFLRPTSMGASSRTCSETSLFGAMRCCRVR